MTEERRERLVREVVELRWEWWEEETVVGESGVALLLLVVEVWDLVVSSLDWGSLSLVVVVVVVVGSLMFGD